MMKKLSNSKKGFTLVELSLALVFIVILLITIAWLTIHISSTYEKGLSMKAINSTAKELIDDFSRAIATSPARSVAGLCSSKYPDDKSTKYKNCVNDNARKFVYQQRYGNVKIDGKVKQVPVNGAFCTGRYSYIWNTAYALNSKDYPSPTNTDYRATLKYSGGSKKDFRLLKISDYSREICSNTISTTEYMYDGYYTYTSTASDLETFIDLLDKDTDGTNSFLALYDLVIFPPAIHEVTSSGFYSGTFILATLRGSIDINSTGEFCSDPPDNLDTDFAYCSINKFNFAMRAAGETSKNDRLR